MDVIAAITRGAGSAGVVAAASAARGHAATPEPRRQASPPPESSPRRFDPSAAIAERLASGVDGRAGSEPPVAPYIPSYVRSAYLARAGQGWWTPSPQALAGYG